MVCGRVWPGQRRGPGNPRGVLRVLLAQAGRDRRSPVAARGAVTAVPETGHQLDPGGGYPLDPPSGPFRLVTEAVTGQRRQHNVKCVGRITAVAGRGGAGAPGPPGLGYRTRA